MMPFQMFISFNCLHKKIDSFAIICVIKCCAVVIAYTIAHNILLAKHFWCYFGFYFFKIFANCNNKLDTPW